MNSEDKFKQLLNEKLNSKEFMLTEENWEKAQQMIDASRRKKRRFGPFLFFGIIVFITGGICFYLFVSNELTKGTLSIAKKENKLSSTKTESGEKANVKPEANKSRKKELTINAEEKTEKLLPKTQLPTNKTIAVTNTSNEETLMIEKNQIVKSEVQKRIKSSIKKSRTSIPLNLSTVNESEIKNHPFVKNNLLQPDKGSTGKNEKDTPKNNNDLNKEEDFLRNTTEIASNAFLQTKDTIQNTEKVSEIVSVVSPSITAINTKDTVISSDSIPLSLKSVGDTLIPKNFFSFEAGVNYLLGWKNADKREAGGFNLLLGVNYLNSVTKKIALSVGIHYTTVNNLHNYSNTSKIGRYRFGEEGSVTIITPTKIHYIQMPFKFCMAFNQKNIVGVGYTFGYLLTVKSKVENYTEQLTAISEKTTSQTNGYVKGFNDHDSQVSVFYRRRIYNNLFINGEAFFGLTDVKDNVFFKSNFAERNSGIKLTFIYNLFKK